MAGRGRSTLRGEAAALPPVDKAPEPAAATFQVNKVSRNETGGFRPKNGGRGGPASLIERSAWTQGSAAAKDLGTADASAPIVDRLPFNIAVVVTTLANIVLIAVEMDFGPGPDAAISDRLGFWVLEITFIALFITELAFRIRHGRGAFFRDVWNVLDLGLVGAAIVAAVGLGSDFRYFTVLRALRVVRLVKLVRMYPAMKELWLLTGGLISSLKALGWVGIVILVVLYVCSIVVTTEIGQNDAAYGTGPSYNGEVWPYQEYFGSVFKSMFTLFQIVTLDGWCDDIVRHVAYRQPTMGVLFVVFIFLMAFGLMNIVVGIIVENTLAAAQVSDRRVQELKGQAKKEAVERLEEVLKKSDSDRTGEISMDEMMAAYQSKIVQDQLERIGLTIDEVREIFKLLDYEQRGRVELSRFADSCRELVGGAKRRDLAQVEVTVGALAQHLERLDSQFYRIETDVSDLTEMANHFVYNTVRVLTGFDGSVQVPPKPSAVHTGPRRGSSLPPSTR